MTMEEEKSEDEVYIPHEVVEMHTIEETSLIEAWRKYKGMTVKEVAEIIGISELEYKKIETSKHIEKETPGTIKKIANAFGVTSLHISI